LRTAPVDPYDAFRGRYVALQFEESSAPLQAKHPVARGQRLYVLLENDADGFARFKEATPVLPQGSDYLQVLTKWTDPEKHTVTFALPFDRFYMQETIAPQAEQMYRKHSRPGQQDAYALVRVRDGLGVVENLYIGDTPIADVARRPPSRP
jgi:uncharacterized membrane-anchored protein